MGPNPPFSSSFEVKQKHPKVYTHSDQGREQEVGKHVHFWAYVKATHATSRAHGRQGGVTLLGDILRLNRSEWIPCEL